MRIRDRNLASVGGGYSSTGILLFLKNCFTRKALWAGSLSCKNPGSVLPQVWMFLPYVFPQFLWNLQVGSLIECLTLRYSFDENNAFNIKRVRSVAFTFHSLIHT